MLIIFNIYDKNETSFTTFGLAILKDVKNPLIRRKINGDHKLTFEYPITPDDEKLQYIEEENIIKVEKQLFRITEIEKIDTGYTQWIKVTAPHIYFDLIDYFTEDNRAVDASVQTALEILLAGTPYSVGQCDDCGVATAYFVEENKLKSINDKIIPRWNCEIEIDNFVVTAKKKIGKDRKYHIRRGKNLKGVNYTENISSVVTRLYVKGKDGLTIEPVTGGRRYVDSPLINNYSHIKADSVTFDEIEDPLELLQAGHEHLETIDKPYVHYDIDLIELRDSEEYKHFRELETFGLGDTCYIYNDRLGIDIDARILEYEYNPKKRRNSTVVLGNFTNRLEDVLGRFEDTKRKVDVSITDDGYVRTGWLQGEINALVNRIVASGAYQHARVLQDKGFLLENTDETSDDYGALYLGPGIFAIADSKKADNTWDWRTFGKGKGFNADLIGAGKVKAQYLQIGSGTDYEDGYNPAEKETPAGAQSKANAAGDDAKAYADNGLRTLQNSLGAAAYADLIEKAMLGTTVIEGGFIKTELLDAKALRIGDENTGVFATKDGIDVKDGRITVKDANNKSVITSNGLKMKYVFVSSGELQGWQKAGIMDQMDGIESTQNLLFVYTPADFIVESAMLHTKSMPYYLTNQQSQTNGGSGAPDGYYHARGLRLHKVMDDTNVYFFVDGFQIYMDPVTGQKQDITPGTWGATWNPTGTRVQTKSVDVAEYLNVGGRTIFAINSNLAPSLANTRYQSALQMELEITGFLRG